MRTPLFKNGEQIEGIASVLDNLGIVAIAAGIVFVTGFGEVPLTKCKLFLLLLAGAGCIYWAFCLRKRLPFSSAPSETLQTPELVDSLSPPSSSTSSSSPMTTPADTEPLEKSSRDIGQPRV